MIPSSQHSPAKYTLNLSTVVLRSLAVFSTRSTYLSFHRHNSISMSKSIMNTAVMKCLISSKKYVPVSSFQTLSHSMAASEFLRTIGFDSYSDSALLMVEFWPSMICCSAVVDVCLSWDFDSFVIKGAFLFFDIVSMLDEVVGKSQSAFVLKRLISDLVMSPIVHFFGMKGGEEAIDPVGTKRFVFGARKHLFLLCRACKSHESGTFV